MKIETTVDGSRAEVAPQDKVTVQTAPELEAAIAALGEGVSDIDIELAGVDYVSSAGLRVFVATSRLCMRRGGTFRLLHPTDDVYDVLEMTGLAEVLDVVR